MSLNLLPCPFCAGPTRIVVVPPRAVCIDQREAAWIECGECRALGPVKRAPPETATAQAAQAWNRRSLLSLNVSLDTSAGASLVEAALVAAQSAQVPDERSMVSVPKDGSDA
jgi:hypothetical protein